MELLITGARVVDCSQDFIGDVYIKDGVISEIGSKLEKSCETIDGKGYIVMPSFIDLHSHFRDPGLTHKEDIYSGSKAALKGGYTAVNLMANTNPVCSELATVEYVLNKSKALDLIDIHQVVSITRDLGGTDISHLDVLSKVEGDTEAKEALPIVRFISDDGKGVEDSKVMLQAMVKAKDKGITVISHAESPELSNQDMRLAENTMTWRDIALAKFTGCSLHMAHVSTKEAMEYVIDGKKSGLNLTCEVTPHHLALSDEVEYRVNPPLRNKEDIAFLVNAIKDGFVDAIATDHAPHTALDKQNGAPGISGIETSFSVSYTTLVKNKGVSLNKLSELMSKRPAELMGLKKGKVNIGYDGDLVIVDIDKNYIIDTESFMSKGKNSPFEGMEVYGEILYTIKSGRIIYSAKEEGEK